MENSLPKGWIKCKLGDIVISRKGKKPKFTIDEYKEGYVPYILIDEMEGKKIRKFTNDPHVPHVDKNDILLVWDGSIGKCGSGLTGAIGSTLIGLTPLGRIPPRFLEYLLISINNYIKETSTGTGLQHINKNFFNICEINLPSLNEQLRISDKLQNLNTKLEQSKKRLAKIPLILKRFRQSVLASAISGKLTGNWRKVNLNLENVEKLIEEIRLSRKELFNSEKEKAEFDKEFELAKPQCNDIGWISFKAKFICDFITKGTTPKNGEIYSKGEIPFLKVYNIVNQELNFNYKPQYITKKIHETYLKRSRVFPGNILMNIVGPPLGKVAIVTNQFPEWNINQAIVCFKPIKQLMPEFLFLILNYGKPVEEINIEFRGTAGQSNISLEQCRDFELAIPSLQEQQEIVRIVEKLFKLTDKLELRYKKAKSYIDKLQQSILSKAFRGELVPQDPNDEPASVLLERIKKEKEKLKKKK